MNVFPLKTTIRDNVGNFVSYNDYVGTFVHIFMTQMSLHKKRKA